MRLLYYLEPNIELENPLFRMGTIRNHLEDEIASLLCHEAEPIEVQMICSRPIADECRGCGYLRDVPLKVIEQEDLQKVYPDYLTASLQWYQGGYSSEASAKMQNLVRTALGTYEPDVIVCYESNAPFLRELFPNALFLNNTLGIFSRPPYPETSCLDPCGLGKDSFLARHGEAIRGWPITPNQAQRVKELKSAYRDALLRYSPVRRDQVRQGFQRVVLAPMQVSRYFMFDGNAPEDQPFRNQLDFLHYVLERLPRDVGVVVTMHGAEAAVMTDEVFADLKRRYPNLLYDPDIQQIRWASQHVLPHVDGVVSVSSSVGLQTLLWDIPLFAVGRSHLQTLSAGPPEDAAEILNSAFSPLDGAFHYLLTRYYPLLSQYHHDPAWYVAFLKRSFARWRDKDIDVSFFDEIAPEEELFSALHDALRLGDYQNDLRRTAPSPAGSFKADGLEAHQAIRNADIVSFDAFDTLITRLVADPKAVFDLVERRAQPLLTRHGIDLQEHSGFRAVRQRAAQRCMDRVKAAGGEEILLDDVYSEIASMLGIDASVTQQLRDLELATERQLHIARPAGRRLFEQAKELGKRIIVVSDIYHSSQFVDELLRGCGYSGYGAVYASSEHGRLKRSGGLFKTVRAQESGKKFLHIGDNHLSDVTMAERSGWKALHLPNISDRYCDHGLAASIWKRRDLGDGLGPALLHGVISRKFYDEPQPEDSWFGGSPYRLGYEAAGPIVLAFARWVLESTRRDGVDDLFFLARDGHLVKLVYDMISRGSNAPRSHYLLASRRAYSTASLRSEAQLDASVSWKFSSCTVRDFLRNRFDVTEQQLVPGSLRQAKLRSLDQTIDSHRPADVERLRTLLTLNRDVLLAAAAREREALLAYFDEEGLFRSRKKAIVDIGHNATLQEALAALTDDRNLGGYYFATFFAAKKVYNKGLPIASYLLSFERNAASRHPYCWNIGMFEFLFLPALPSFKRFVRNADGTVRPEFVEGDESHRYRIIEQVHEGALDFCRDILRATGDDPQAFDIASNDALRAYLHFAEAPHKADAQMLTGISFVDAFGGSMARYLIEPLPAVLNPARYATYRKKSWWRKGAIALVQGHEAVKKINGRPHPRSPWQRKIAKLRREPGQFVSDLRVLRPARRWLSSFRAR